MQMSCVYWCGECDVTLEHHLPKLKSDISLHAEFISLFQVKLIWVNTSRLKTMYKKQHSCLVIVVKFEIH